MTDSNVQYSQRTDVSQGKEVNTQKTEAPMPLESSGGGEDL